jgi:AraC-like DNA-binding protein
MVVVRRFPEPDALALPAAHAHDHLVLAHFTADGGSLRSTTSAWELAAGDTVLVAPGEVYDASGLAAAHGWAVFFSPAAIGQQAPGAFFAWRSHPLLFAFVQGLSGPPHRLSVPGDERAWWARHLMELEAELREKEAGFRHAALAHLTLLLVAVARLAADIPRELRLNGEPLLADVFAVIEARYRGPLSLKDVAEAVSLTPGHLTTVVRRKTGRTVQGWISDRRMAEARQILVDTDLPVSDVGQHVGFVDPAYFVRAFKQVHGSTPLAWRRTARLEA